MIGKRPGRIAPSTEIDPELILRIELALRLEPGSRRRLIRRRIDDLLDTAQIASTSNAAPPASARAKVFVRIGKRADALSRLVAVDRKDLAGISKASAALLKAVGPVQEETPRGVELSSTLALLQYQLARAKHPGHPEAFIQKGHAIRLLKAHLHALECGIAQSGWTDARGRRRDLARLGQAAIDIRIAAAAAQDAAMREPRRPRSARHAPDLAFQLILAELLQTYQELTGRSIGTSTNAGNEPDGPLLRFLELTAPLAGYRLSRAALRARIKTQPDHLLPKPAKGRCNPVHCGRIA